jgi:hypothetical protein
LAAAVKAAVPGPEQLPVPHAGSDSIALVLCGSAGAVRGALNRPDEEEEEEEEEEQAAEEEEEEEEQEGELDPHAAAELAAIEVAAQAAAVDEWVRAQQRCCGDGSDDGAAACSQTLSAVIGAVLGVLVRRVEMAAAAEEAEAHGLPEYLQPAETAAELAARRRRRRDGVMLSHADFEGRATRERVTVYVTQKPDETPRQIAARLGVSASHLISLNSWFELRPSSRLLRKTPLLYDPATGGGAAVWTDGVVLPQPRASGDTMASALFWKVAYGVYDGVEVEVDKTSHEVRAMVWASQCHHEGWHVARPSAAEGGELPPPPQVGGRCMHPVQSACLTPGFPTEICQPLHPCECNERGGNETG